MPKFSYQKSEIFYQKNYDDAGQNPVLILVHGSTGNSYHWPEQLRKADYPVLAIDLPGHGRSKGRACTTSLQSAKVIAKLISTEKISSYYLAGHSLGGTIVLSFALDLRKRLLKEKNNVSSLLGLIVVSSGARLPVNKLIRDGVKTEEGKLKVAAFMSKVAYGKSNGSDGQITAEMIAIGRKAMERVPAEIFAADFGSCHRFNIVKKLDQITSPVLILCGTEDKMTPIQLSEELSRGLANAKLVAFPDAGHMLPLERPKAVAAEIFNFISAK